MATRRQEDQLDCAGSESIALLGGLIVVLRTAIVRPSDFIQTNTSPKLDLERFYL